jgi:hypothetical protein
VALNRALRLARECGVEVRFADLGDWGADELRSEYDPDGPVIRLNLRYIEALDVAEIGEFITLAVAHELYHHREALGDTARLSGRTQRELAADAFARELLALS